MIVIENKKVIDTILGMDEEMAVRMLEVSRLEYDFLNEEIILKNNENATIGVYNLLPNRRKDLQSYINNSL